MPTRAQIVAAINSFRGRTPTNPIDDELANFMQAWLDYYDQTGAWDPATVSTLVSQNAALQNGLISRSLNLTATIYVDGVNGNDARTGTTSDANAATGCVKTLARVAALHSGKTGRLTIYFIGSLAHSNDVIIEVPEINFYVGPGLTLTFAKRSLGAFGECNYRIKLRASHVSIFNQGTITVEGHAPPPGSPTEWNYTTSQGAFCLIKGQYWEYEAGKHQVFNCMGGTINIGTYCVFATTGREAGENNFLARFHSPSGNVSTTWNVGTGAIIHDLTGDRITPRQYHPTGAADGNVGWGEIVLSPSTNQLYANRAGTVRLIQALRRYHPTSSTDASVWEGEMVISTSNGDLYYKNNGTIRRVTTAVYS